jgi:Concanavalin A-like lectin/glucanases superfamily
MTALYMDGFDHYGTGALSTVAMKAGPYASTRGQCGVPPWGLPRTGISCFTYGGNVSDITVNRRVMPTPGTHFFVSFGFAVDALTNATNQNIGFLLASTDLIVAVSWDSTGALQLVDGSGAILAQSGGPVIVAENWHFFEMEVDTSAHTFTLRVDDADGTNTPILSVTNSNITGSIAQIGLLSGNSGSTPPPTAYIDDLFVRDAAGTVNNTFLGDRRIATLFPDADTTTAGWSPSFYHEFGPGILTNAFLQTGSNTIQNPQAYVGALASSQLDIGAADFTMETMIRFDALPATGTYSSIFNYFAAAQNERSYRLILGDQGFNGGCLQFDTSTDGTSATLETMIQYPWVPLTNTWYHLAICRSGGDLLLFVDGQQFGLPIPDARTYFTGGTQPFSIGIETFGVGFGGVVNNTELVGRLDETRFTNGVGRYTGPFSPPVAAFPRGTSDPDWAQVVLLMGYDSGIIDESSFNRSVVGADGAVSFLPNDGIAVGVFSTLNKPVPDDNTFIAASLFNATDILTMTSQPTNGTTVTVGTKDGTVPAVYTFKTVITTAFDVLIDTTAQNTLINLFNAINVGPGIGTKYGTGTTSNFDVNAIQLPVGQIEAVANIAGTGGNSIPATSTSTASWATSTLAGGASIPGPSNFKFQRPPNNTTIISALQTTVRALKTDAGPATIQAALIGPLGGVADGALRNLTVSASYYSDMFEIDPDTSQPITPTTIINGQVQINRTV